MRIVVKDYKRIRSADVSLKGLTLIQGGNSNGKSTLVKSIRAALLNSSNENSFRYGANEFSVQIMLEDAQKVLHSVIYSRKGKDATYTDSQGIKLGKLNKAVLGEVIPDFPLKLFQFKDSKFYPNIVFQQEVPMFSQVDVYELFSGMFEVVFKLLTRQQQIKKESGDLTSLLKKTETEVEFQKNQLLDTQKGIDALPSEATVLAGYQKVQEFQILQQRHLTSYQSAGSLQIALESYASLAWTDSIADLSAFQQAVVLLQKGNDLLHRKAALSERTASLQAQVGSFTVLDLTALEKGVPLQEKLTQIRARVALIPPPKAVPQVASLIAVAERLYSLKSWSAKAASIEASIVQAAQDKEVIRQELLSVDTCPLCDTKGIHLEVS